MVGEREGEGWWRSGRPPVAGERGGEREKASFALPIRLPAREFREGPFVITVVYFEQQDLAETKG